MNDNTPLEKAQRDLGEGRPAWAQSPLMLLAGLILVAGVIAVLVTALGGGDDVASDADTPAEVTTSDSADEANAGDAATADGTDEAAAAPVVEPGTFGGPDIPEIAPVIVVGSPLAQFTGEGADPALGQTVPVTQATSLATGEVVELAAGQPRIIGFFAHWCPHCQAELPELTAWLDDAGLPNGAEFVAVSTVVDDTRGNYPPSAWFTAEGWSETVLVDDEAATLLQAYGFSGFPAFIAIDADGTVLDRLGGNAGIAGFERLSAALN
jgi:thiol-disulfide isomerase/thioredoxin